MRTLLSFSVLLALVVGTSAARACVPDPTKSTYGHILVGSSSGLSANQYEVVTRDVGNVPLAGVTVTIYLAGSGARADLEQEPGTTVNCAAGTLSRVTDGNGVAVFHARIAGYDDGSTVQVRANGMLFGSIQVRSTDLNGDGVTDLRDVNAFREEFVLQHGGPETDFNLDGVTNGYDFGVLRTEFVNSSHNSVCP
jgi:hypothetical protein